jgi:hypothetical protein
MTTTITISKSEAASRQFTEAVRLFFEFRDPIAVHTLAASAHQLLTDLGKQANVKSNIRELDVPDELKPEWHRLINEPYNFFKHADRDASLKLIFNPQLTEWLLLDGSYMAEHLCQPLPYSAVVFRAWFFLDHSELMTSDDVRQYLDSLNKDINSRDRSFFLGELSRVKP